MNSWVSRSLRRLLQQVVPVPRRRSAAGSGRGRRLAVECLEDRTLLSTLAPIPVFDPTLPASASSGGVSQPLVSYDGRYVVYTATAPSLVPNQENEAPVANIYLYDTQTQTTTLVSHVPGQLAVGADGPSAFPGISGDDRYVVYSSQATDLVPGQRGLQTGVRGLNNVFLYNIAGGTTTLVSHAAGAPAVSGNDDSDTAGTTGFGFTQNGGRYLLFLSQATNLVSGQDSASHVNLFLYDTQKQTTTLVSHAAGAPTTVGSNDTYAADISQDGSFVVYTSLATNLVSGQQGQAGNVFLYDNRAVVSGSANPTYGHNALVSGAYNPATNGPSPTVGAGFALTAAINAGGTIVTYLSEATNLVPFQTTDVDPGTGQPYPPTFNVFAYGGTPGQTYLLSGMATPSGPSPSVTSNGDALRLAVSGDGSSVAFISNAGDLYPTQSGPPGQGVNSGNVFLDRLNPSNPAQRTLFLASYDANLFQLTGGGTYPAGGVHLRNSANDTDLSIGQDSQDVYVTYQSRSGSLVLGQTPPPGAPSNVVNSFVFSQPLGGTVTGTNAVLSRVNGTPPGTVVTGNYDSTGARLSGNGGAVAFESQATNLNPNGVNGAPLAQDGANLFVFPAFGSGPSLLSSQTVVQVNAQSYVYGTSADGRYVVFTSNSPAVVAGQVDTNADQDVFVRDTLTGTTALVSHVPGATLTAGNAGSPNTLDGTQPPGAPVVISQDGNWIAFVSNATNLVAGEQVPVPQTNNVYLFDNRPGSTYGTVTLVSGMASGSGESPTLAGDANSFNPAISADGSFVAFVSVASNLFPPLALQFAAINRTNVYLFDNRPGSTYGNLTILSDRDAGGTTGDGNSGSPSLSDDGRYVAFESRSTNLISGTNVTALDNVYLVDTQTQQTTLVSHTASAPTTEADASSFDPVVSPDGSFVAFVSYANDLVLGQRVTPYTNVFLYDVATGAVRLVSGVNGSTTFSGTGFSDSPALSVDGTQVVFRSDAPDLVAGQSNTPGTASRVFRFAEQTGAVTLVSHVAGSATTTAAGNSEAPGIDGAGDLVVYVSTGNDLVPGQVGGGVNNVFLYATALGDNALLSGENGSHVQTSTDPTYLAVISRDPAVVFNVFQVPGGHVADTPATVRAFINTLIQTTVALAGGALANGTGPNAVVGTFSTESPFDGQYQPTVTYLLVGGVGDDGRFQVSGGQLLTGAQTSVAYSAQPSYTIQVLTDVGLTTGTGLALDGLDTLALAVSPARGGGGGGGGGGGSSGRGDPLTARLVFVKPGRKKPKRLMVEVFDAVTGAEKETFVSPFQPSRYQNIQVSVRYSNGVPTQVVVTARKRKTPVTATYPV